MNMKFDLEGCDITKELKMIEEGKKPKRGKRLMIKPKRSDYINARILMELFGPVPCELDVPHIVKVIFHNPATIVFWSDGTKTVVKVQGKERFNKEKGLAMAIAKKALGNKYDYYEEFKKWL